MISTCKSVSNLEKINNDYSIRYLGKMFVFWVSLVVSTSRPIKIEIENVLSVETNFWKPSRFSRRSRSTFILSRSRFLKSRLFSRDKDVSRFLSRSSRLIETFETNRDKTRFFEIFVNNRDFVEINRDLSRLFEKNLNFPHFLPILKPILKHKM